MRAGETRLQSGRINAFDHQPQPGVGRRAAKPQAERFVQPLQMNANEFMHLPVGVGPSDHAENGVQQPVARSNRLPSRDDGPMVRKTSSSDAASDNLRFGLSPIDPHIFACGNPSPPQTTQGIKIHGPVSAPRHFGALPIVGSLRLNSFQSRRVEIDL